MLFYKEYYFVKDYEDLKELCLSEYPNAGAIAGLTNTMKMYSKHLDLMQGGKIVLVQKDGAEDTLVTTVAGEFYIGGGIWVSYLVGIGSTGELKYWFSDSASEGHYVALEKVIDKFILDKMVR